MTTRLDQDRKQIDEIDAQIASLFEERFKVVADVIDYKIEKRIPILDSSREAEIMDRNTARIKDDDIRPYYRKCFAEILRLSKEYQKDILDQK